MSTISRINYQKKAKGMPDFEIVDLGLFFATRPKRFLEKEYRMNFWAIIYITEGNGKHIIDFEEFSYNSGDIIILQKNQVHRFVVNINAKGYIININEPFLLDANSHRNNAFLKLIDQVYGKPLISVDNNKESTNRKLIEILYSEYNRGALDADEELIKSLFSSFILSIGTQFSYKSSVKKTSGSKTFAQFRHLVEDNYDKHLTLDDYSRMMGVSKKTINQAAREVVDLSAKEFVNNRLFLEIKRYLSQGELLNYEISDVLGFDEPSNMTKFFKKHEGVSPKEFRNRFNYSI